MSKELRAARADELLFTAWARPVSVGTAQPELPRRRENYQFSMNKESRPNPVPFIQELSFVLQINQC